MGRVPGRDDPGAGLQRARRLGRSRRTCRDGPPRPRPPGPRPGRRASRRRARAGRRRSCGWSGRRPRNNRTRHSAAEWRPSRRSRRGRRPWPTGSTGGNRRRVSAPRPVQTSPLAARLRTSAPGSGNWSAAPTRKRSTRPPVADPLADEGDVVPGERGVPRPWGRRSRDSPGRPAGRSATGRRHRSRRSTGRPSPGANGVSGPTSPIWSGCRWLTRNASSLWFAGRGQVAAGVAADPLAGTDAPRSGRMSRLAGVGVAEAPASIIRLVPSGPMIRVESPLPVAMWWMSRPPRRQGAAAGRRYPRPRPARPRPRMRPAPPRRAEGRAGW